MDIQFQFPENWWWLLAVPIVLALSALYLFWKRRRLMALADMHLLPYIIPHHSAVRQWLKYACVALAIGLLALAMINPQKPDEKAGAQVKGLDLLLVLDVSQSMLANDISPDRLENAKQLAGQLIDTLQGSRIGLLAFAGDARLLSPLTNDLSAVSDLLSTLNTESVTLDGTDIATAISTAVQGMGKSDPTHKAVLLITDGEELDGEASSAIAELKQTGVHFMAVGMGTAAGSLVKDRQGIEIRNAEGARVISRLNEKMLMQLAIAANGKYIASGKPGEQLKEVMATIQEIPSKPLMNSYLVNYYSYSHLLIFVAFVLLVFALVLSERKSKQMNKAMQAAILLTLCMLPAAVFAQSSAYNWQKADELYQKGKLAEAEKEYQQGLRKQPDDWRAKMLLGNIAFRKGDHEGAMKYYQSAAAKAQQKDQASWLQNNMGLSLVQQQKTAEAIEAFKQALRKNPFDEEVQQNLAQAMADWQEQQNRKPPPPQKKMNQQDKLNALQQEEKRIRQSLQKKHPRDNNGKNW